MLPLYKYSDQLPDSPALHVVVVHKEEDQPDPGGDVDLQHDDGEEETPEDGAKAGMAENPGPGEQVVVPCYNHQGHLDNLKRNYYSLYFCILLVPPLCNFDK